MPLYHARLLEPPRPSDTEPRCTESHYIQHDTAFLALRFLRPNIRPAQMDVGMTDAQVIHPLSGGRYWEVTQVAAEDAAEILAHEKVLNRSKPAAGIEIIPTIEEPAL